LLQPLKTAICVDGSSSTTTTTTTTTKVQQ
jgi:hypothetical protein